MEKRSVVSRFLFPLLLVIGVHQVAGLIYDVSSGLAPGMFRDIFINVFGPLTFVSLWFFAFLGPPLAFFRGATVLERTIVAFANPVIWVISVEAKVCCQYSPAEMVYFFLLPWTFGIICVTCVEFSLAELICRFVQKKRQFLSQPVFHPAPVTLFTFGMIGTYFGLIKGQEWVYFVVHHYTDTFLR